MPQRMCGDQQLTFLEVGSLLPPSFLGKVPLVSVTVFHSSWLVSFRVSRLSLPPSHR